ncbi:MAG: hypothetical protein HC862_19205 [Scytonema sp. RU_4_4]|nr:hypothetical protein [Scytonema sp. RU_4_4]
MSDNLSDSLKEAVLNFGAKAGRNILSKSKEHKQFLSSYKCPNCNKALGNSFLGKLDKVKFYSANGNRILVGGSVIGDIAGCDECNYRWSMNEDTKSTILKFSNIVETEQTQEFIGKVERLVDNSESGSIIRRRITFSKEVSKDYFIEYEKSQSDGTEKNAGLKVEIFEASIGETSQNIIREKYSITKGERIIRAEELEVEIPGYTKLNLIVSWKRIWQHGFIKFCSQNGEELNVPFKVVTELTFDQVSKNL